MTPSERPVHISVCRRAARLGGLVVVGAISLACGSEAADSSESADSTEAHVTAAATAPATTDLPSGPQTTATVSTSSAGRADVEAAREGLGRYLAEHRPATPQTTTNLDGCPALTSDRLNDGLAAVGMSDTIDELRTEIEWSEWEDLHRGLMGIVCGGDSDGNPFGSDVETSVDVFGLDVDGFTTVEDVLALVGLDPSDSDDVGDGWMSAAMCDERSDVPTCFEFRHRDGFVLGLSVASVTDPVDADLATELLDELFGDLLAGLAGV